MCDRSLEDASRVADEIVRQGGRALAVRVDVGDEADVVAALGEAGQLGPIDTLVACAGIGHLVPFERMKLESWHDMLRVHLDGTFLCARHTIGPMLEAGHGRIICVSSVAATQGVAYEVHYSAAKAGIEGFVRALSRETASRGVTVNAIAPGYIDTPLNRLIPGPVMDALERNIPLGRLGRPEEIGALAAYLASPEADYMTGQVVTLDGGFTYGDSDQDPELAAMIEEAL